MSGYLRIVSFESDPTNNYPLKRIEWYLIKTIGIGYQMTLILNVISDGTDMKRDIRWYWYERWYQCDTDMKRNIRWHWYETWYQCDIDSQNQWYTLNWSGLLTRMWKRNKLVTAMEALIPYWYQQRNQWYTLNQRKSIWKIVIPNQWYQPIEEGNYRNLLLKAIEGAYRRGQL